MQRACSSSRACSHSDRPIWACCATGDKDGGGAIDFLELKKILQTKPPTVQKTKKAVQATMATRRMTSATSAMMSLSPSKGNKPADVKVPPP